MLVDDLSLLGIACQMKEDARIEEIRPPHGSAQRRKRGFKRFVRFLGRNGAAEPRIN